MAQRAASAHSPRRAARDVEDAGRRLAVALGAGRLLELDRPPVVLVIGFGAGDFEDLATRPPGARIASSGRLTYDIATEPAHIKSLD